MAPWGAVGIWKVRNILELVKVGSGDWTWQQEFDDLDARDSELLAELEESIKREGVKEPVTIGSDRRLWDGHHRVWVAVRLGLEEIPVDVVV
jgi:citrate lyase alpha subunit